MGKPSIANKLDKEIVKGIKTEAQVVYMLVEARKIIKDHDNQLSSYPILHFFCDWSVHAKMEYKSAKRMLNNIQDFYRGLDTYLYIRKNTSFFPFVMLIVLRRELKLFLKQNSLSLSLVNDNSQWENFLYLLINVIIDCPLIATSGFIREFRFIEYASKDKIRCNLKLQTGDIHPFISVDRFDFIEKDFN